MLLFFSIFFSFSVFSSNINLFNEAKNIEKQEVKSLLNSFNSNLETLCNYQLEKDDLDDNRLNELLQKIKLINDTCTAFLNEAKREDVMPKLLTHKEVAKSSLEKAATKIGAFFTELSGKNNDGFSLLNLTQQSEKLNTIAAKLNELQTSQQTILFLLSPEEIDLNKAPITEVVIEPDTDRDQNIALENNLNIWREQEEQRLQLQQANQRIIQEEQQVNQRRTQEITEEPNSTISIIEDNQITLNKWGINSTELESNPRCNMDMFDFCILSNQVIENPESLAALPNEILFMIMKKLSLKDQRSFAKTCRFTKLLFDEYYNDHILRKQLFPMTKNMFLIDDNWLIVFIPSKEDSLINYNIFNYNIFDDNDKKLKKHKILLFYRIDSDSSFNLINKCLIDSDSVAENFKGFLKHKDSNKIYLLFDFKKNDRFYIYSIKDIFSCYSFPIFEEYIVGHIKSLWLAEKGFSKSSSKDIFDKCFTFIDRRFLFSSLRFFSSIEHDLEKIFCEIQENNKSLDEKFKDIKIHVKIDSNQIERILKKYPKDSHKYQLLTSYLNGIKLGENDIEKFISLQKKYLSLKKRYKLMHETIKNKMFQQKINYKKEKLLYSIVTKEKRKEFLKCSKKIEQTSLFSKTEFSKIEFSKTDEQIVQEFEHSLEILISFIYYNLSFYEANRENSLGNG